MGFSVRNQACLVKVANVNINSSGSGDKLEIDLLKVEGNHESAMMDMAYGGQGKTLSSDEIATLRARRILLGDIQENASTSIGDLLLESMITNPTNSSINSIVPNLIAKLQNEQNKLTRIRVITVGYLILTGTVERIEKLNFKTIDGIVTEVTFIGYRKNITQM